MARVKSRYVPALDGLRAFAVLAVIAYHMHLNWAPGGLLGVTMFFVLSGYLITGLLLKESEETGTISLSNFWLRRVRRIIPAVVFSVLGIALLCTILDHALLTKMRPDVVPTLLFVNNWWQIFHNVSYFAALGEPSPLTHFWSLAIEEQFYLVWPVALLVCMKFGVSRSTMQKGTLALIVISALEMIILFNPEADPSRVYYGTDTRAFSLLIGALLAFIWPYQELTERAGNRMTQSGRLVFNVVGVVAVIGLLVMCAVTNGFSPFIYRGGLLICSLLTAVAIAVMVHPISWMGRFFELPPLVWIGKCSYSMYLWHFPIILLMTPNNMVGDAPIWLRLVQLIVIFAISAFSYYVVENPIRHGAIGNFIGDLRTGEFTIPEWVGAHLIPVVIAAVFFVVPTGGLALVPEESSVNNVAALQDQAAEESESEAEEAANATQPYDILLIGDSVSVRAIPYFEETFPFGHIDSAVSRQFYQAAELYNGYADEGRVGDVVVIALGTNGYATEEQAEDLMKAIGSDKHVWFINTRSPEVYMESSNATIANCVAKHDNAELIDWYSYSEGKEDLFDGDGTHLTDEAAQIYTGLIHDAVKDYLPEHSEEEYKALKGAQDQSSDSSSSESASTSGESTSSASASAA